MSDPRNTATGDWLARESLAFERDYARSRHNASPPECRCAQGMPVCWDCPEKGAPMASRDHLIDQEAA